MLKKFLERVESIGYSTNKLDSGSIKIGLDCCPEWNVLLIDIDDDRMLPYFYLRKYRVEEVTDLHDILPTVLTTIIKANGTSSFRFLGEHNEFSGIDDELYGMYWFPAQPLNEKLRKNSENDLDCFFNILFDLYMFHMYQGDILGANDYEPVDFSSDSPELKVWVDSIVEAIGKDESYVANLRVNPDWFYFRSFSAAFSIFKSPHIATLLKGFACKKSEGFNDLEGVESSIEIHNDIRNTIPFSDYDFSINVLQKLGDKSTVEVVPQENLLVFISDEHVIMKYSNCGAEAVAIEKELIRERQQREISLLFGDRQFVWNIADRNSSAEFEDLILELLNREAWVFSVKKVAPTNQGDNGRDLICEYNMLHNEHQISKDVGSVQIGKMIVQCKTNLNTSKKTSVGKSDVDIANAIFDYRPDGYMLVVNTQITRDLTEMLERQKERREQNAIVWWNAFDVEDRLRKHPDILARYRHLVYYE
ncbi:hypothetical protein IDSA_06775 [Pseudidiomarina salinarum]|uniref:Restriction endonuclease type IV Mrr domain-containing protein n=1 Tax=Pseudidiomarina salinarum TaxID=435908 RepID=A0A094IYA9_9GAMM|nr:restriction endonuclease [Pseudidiomarina salinarum]KFZ30789.1 hypothetical protein IDSA_06775 [Pseudidiomarina salinarum]RUO71256.1 hypothetical protein CWI79_07465 [Pseudidiomarina salinarum]